MGFARMGYVGDGLFDLSFMRHTEQWSELYQNLSLDECLEAVKNDPSSCYERKGIHAGAVKKVQTSSQHTKISNK